MTLLVGLAFWVLPWSLGHLSSREGWESAWRRVGSFVEAFADPDFSYDTLRLSVRLAGETLAMATLGVALGLVLAYPLAVLSSSTTLDDGARISVGRRWGRTMVRESSRALLDILRGVPDFAWALVLLTIFGPTPITALLAIAAQVAGILGKIFSELWDGTSRAGGVTLRATGANRIQVLLYGTQPLAGRGMLSFLLMRFECAVRNASVIGAVCGGGLGAAVLQELGYDNKGRAVTLLLAMLVVTVSADLLSNVLRSLLRRERSRSLTDARRRRWLAGLGLTSALGLSLFQIREPLSSLGAELRRLDLRYLREHYGQLLVPDLSLSTLEEALAGMVLPLALGILSTLSACVFAGIMAWWGSVTFQLHGERFLPEPSTGPQRMLRRGLVGWTRLLGVILRGIPEVAWVWILALFLLTGPEAALGAMMLHSTGILARVFTETVDNIPDARLEHLGTPSRFSAFTFGALPLSRTDWRSYALFQFESNVRTGVVLGIVGVGGLGYLFRRALAHGAMSRASTFLLALVLLTLCIDRLSRRIQSGPRC